MRKLLDFLFRKRHWFLFILLEVVSLILVYRNTNYQRNVFISSANVVTGHISSISGNISSYLNLRETNHELTERNGELEMRVLELQSRLERISAENTVFEGFIPDSAQSFPFRFVLAKVVNNSVIHLSNYLTIDKGQTDGIFSGMGVVSERGVVGTVSHVSDHFAVVLPLLNPKSQLSCKLKGSNNFGTLRWNGRNARYAQLDELARHIEFEKGDTIITSGHSAIFPAGIMVGKVADFRKQHDDNFYSLEVELSTDFQALNNVRILINDEQTERLNLEKEAMR